MSARKTDFRLLQHKRDVALARPELSAPPKPRLDPALVEAAIADGKLRKVPPQKRARL